MKYPQVERCDNGTIRTKSGGHPGADWWKFGHCSRCDVVTLPWFTRRLDLAWWR